MLSFEMFILTYDDVKTNGVKTGDKITATMANGDIIESEQDLRGNMLNATYKTYNSETDKHTATALTVATYDDKNQLKTLADKISGVAYGWDYDALDRLESYSGGRTAEKYEYNSDGDVSKKTVTVDGENRVYEYAYKNTAAKDLESVTVGNICLLPKSDCLGRNTGKEIKVNGTAIASESIAYRKHGDHATNMPSVMRFGNHVATAGDKTQFVQLDNLKYKYDACGNISEVWENGTLAAKYTYDKLNRIVREDNKQLKKTALFTYDNNGNILSKREFAFTLKEAEKLEETDETQNLQYAYNGDRLLAYGNETLVYDILGNPTNYLGKACSWQRGRQLSAYNGVTFEYDGQGRRTKKVGNTTVTYVYDSNGKLVLQDYPQKSIKLKFLYDNGGLCAVQKGEDTFYYRKDAQGNIIALLDGSGVVVVRYSYNAWGDCKVLDANGKAWEIPETHIGALNPFRYRGYYYDTETELYYLKTRYYDPETGRFITIDDLQYLDPETINGLNLYAYCGNNPVMNVDPEGTKWWDWLLGGLSLLAGIALCFVPGGQVFGVGLIVGGASSLVSCSLDAAGVSGKWASIITSGLSIIAGIALCFTPFAGIGAGMIGQGVGAIAGGFISEACGGSFTTGAAIGGFIGSIVGGAAYRGVTNYRLSKMTPYQKGVMGEKYVKAIYGDKAYKPTTGSNRPDLLFKDGSTLIEVKNVATQGYTGQLQRYLNMGVEKNIIYVRLGTKISSALNNSAYIIKYFPW